MTLRFIFTFFNFHIPQATLFLFLRNAVFENIVQYSVNKSQISEWFNYLNNSDHYAIHYVCEKLHKLRQELNELFLTFYLLDWEKIFVEWKHWHSLNLEKMPFSTAPEVNIFLNKVKRFCVNVCCCEEYITVTHAEIAHKLNT